MKTIYIVISTLLTVLLLIIAFENINSTLGQWHFLFSAVDQFGAFTTILELAFIGIIIGASFTLFMIEVRKPDEEEPGSNIFKQNE